MANNIGAKSNIQIKDSAGTLRDISAYVTSVDFDRTADAVDTTTLGQTSKTGIPGLQDITIGVSGLFDPTFAGYLDGLMTFQGTASSLQTYQWGPAGTATGSLKYTGSYFITDYRTSSAVAGAVQASFTIKGSGSGTATTF